MTLARAVPRTPRLSPPIGVLRADPTCSLRQASTEARYPFDRLGRFEHLEQSGGLSVQCQPLDRTAFRESVFRKLACSTRRGVALPLHGVFVTQRPLPVAIRSVASGFAAAFADGQRLCGKLVEEVLVCRLVGLEVDAQRPELLLDLDDRVSFWQRLEGPVDQVGPASAN
jgi:hypothetical protein